MKKVVVLVGPTASGKTRLSLEIAKSLNLEIINGDSVQIYQELNIGSAKANPEERQMVKHHLLDLKKAGENYTVYDYQKDVRNLINQIDYPFIVGGSGFYIKSSLYDYEFNYEDQKAINYPLDYEEIIDYIKINDPNLKIDFNNQRRVLRAYEQLLNGEIPSKKTSKNDPLYDLLILYLDYPRDKQKAKMIERVEKQIEEGFIEEVQNLREKAIYIDDIIGYREINLYLDQKISLKEAKELIVKKTFQFSKRQKTWFINQMKPVILDAMSPDLIADGIKLVKEFLNLWKFI